MEYIKGHCRTNLDGHEILPAQFYKVPNVGESVTYRYGQKLTILNVLQITHDIIQGEPYIIVELHN